MGTCGNRPGNKIYSFNTTLRSSDVRNERFLLHFADYDGKVFRDVYKEYLKEIVSDGTYKFNRMTEDIRAKLNRGELLSDDEIDWLIVNNPQKCGIYGRLMTQLRSLKEQGFLKFHPNPSNPKYISITKLGRELIGVEEYSTDVYCKAMIGLHANNPSRIKMWNKSRPFLNTLFVMNEVEKMWKELGRDDTGIARYEFSAFILTMKDCDYMKAAKAIIEYRKSNGNKIVYNYEKLKTHALAQDAINVNEDNIKTEYSDEVFRKFKMTGLVEARGSANYRMYSFSPYNMEKVNAILKMYKDYSFVEFENQDAYYDFLENIALPWQIDLDTRIEIAKAKAALLGEHISDYSNIVKVEQFLDHLYYSNVLSDAIDASEINSLRNELLILSGALDKTSIFKDLDEPLRLEYVLALVLGKRFGKKGLISNIVYNSSGYPLNHAGGKKADLVYKHLNLSFIMEPTMIKSPSEMMTKETTGVVEHYLDEKAVDPNLNYGMLVSPFTNSRVARFYRYAVTSEDVNIIPISIEVFVDMIDNSSTIDELESELDKYLKELKDKTPELYTDLINGIHPSVTLVL